jgi:uncharacterized membrane protein
MKKAITLTAVGATIVAAALIGPAYADHNSNHYTLGQEIVTTTYQFPAVNGSQAALNAECPTGKVVTGGGFGYSPNTVDVHSSGPTSSTVWQVNAVTLDSSAPQLSAYAICVKP